MGMVVNMLSNNFLQCRV